MRCRRERAERRSSPNDALLPALAHGSATAVSQVSDEVGRVTWMTARETHRSIRRPRPSGKWEASFRFISRRAIVLRMSDRAFRRPAGAGAAGRARSAVRTIFTGRAPRGCGAAVAAAAGSGPPRPRASRPRRVSAAAGRRQRPDVALDIRRRAVARTARRIHALACRRAPVSMPDLCAIARLVRPGRSAGRGGLAWCCRCVAVRWPPPW